MEGFMQHRVSETAKIIPFAYQRLPSTKQPSWNSSNTIFKKLIRLSINLIGGSRQIGYTEKLNSFNQDKVTRQVDNLPIKRQHLQNLSNSVVD